VARVTGQSTQNESTAISESGRAIGLPKPYDDTDHSGEQDELQESCEGFAVDVFVDGRDGERAENDYQGAD